MRVARGRVAGAALALTALGLGACEGDPPSRDAGAADGGARFPCQLEGYPCTWGEVPDSIRERTQTLGEMAALFGTRVARGDSVVAFLLEQRGVVEAEASDDVVRFRLAGGRPVRVGLPGEFDHHRSPPGGSDEATDTTGVRSVGEVDLPARTSVAALLRGLGPRPLAAASPRQDEGLREAVVGEPGEGKHALIISPFDFEFDAPGARFARATRVIRDYREDHGGSVTFHADLDRFDDNPVDPGADYRTLGGDDLLGGPVTIDDFLHWDRYQLVLLASHGGWMGCDEGPGMGPTTGQCAVIYAGRAKYDDYSAYPGVELYMSTASVEAPYRPADQSTAFETPGERAWTEGLATGLTSEQVRRCAALLDGDVVERGDDRPTLPDGTSCMFPVWHHDNPRVVLWWPFFKTAYPRGLENSIIFLAACHSARDGVIPRLLAPDGNEAVSVFGFDTAVKGDRAWTLILSLIDLIREGWHTREIARRLAEVDLEWGELNDSSPGNRLRGRLLAPEDEVAPDRPARLLGRDPGATHGRDIVRLIDLTTGRELEAGATLAVARTSPDRNSTLPLAVEIIGLTRPAAGASALAAFLDTPSDAPAGMVTAIQDLGNGVWRHPGPLDVGAHLEAGDVVDVGALAILPGKGREGDSFSIWWYPDVRIVEGTCRWTARLDGGGVGGGLALEGTHLRLQARNGRIESIRMAEEGPYDFQARRAVPPAGRVDVRPVRASRADIRLNVLQGLEVGTVGEVRLDGPTSGPTIRVEFEAGDPTRGAVLGNDAGLGSGTLVQNGRVQVTRAEPGVVTAGTFSATVRLDDQHLDGDARFGTLLPEVVEHLVRLEGSFEIWEDGTNDPCRFRDAP